MKNIRGFYLNFFSVLEVKCSTYLHRRVFVMYLNRRVFLMETFYKIVADIDKS